MPKRNRASNNRAKQFETDMMSTFRNAGGWCERFTDLLVWKGEGAPPQRSAGPPDLCALLHGNAYLVECKARDVSQSKSIVFDRLAPHQLTSLLQFAANGGRAYVAVLWYGHSNASKDTVALMIPVQVWHRLKATLGKKSLNIDDVIDEKGVKRLTWVGRTQEGVGPWTLQERRESLRVVGS